MPQIGEVAVTANQGSSAVDIKGWRLDSVTGSQTYTFPTFTLAAGTTVSIVSGPSAVNNPPDDLLWTTGYIWNNSGGPGELYDATDTLVSSYP